MKILDVYLLKKFFSTIIFILALLLLIFLVLDINEKYNRYNDAKLSIPQVLYLYYPYYIIWAINTFFSIIVFVSVILFTSRITNQTEVVAIISGGISFFRFSLPYFIGAGLIAFMTLSINHFILPWANIKKNQFETKYLLQGEKKVEYESSKPIASQLSPNEYLFVSNYNRISKSGNGFHYIKYDSKNNLLHEIMANELVWDNIDGSYVLKNYYEKYVKPNKPDSLLSGYELSQKFKFTPDQLLPESYVAETMNSIELKKFIQNEEFKGSGNTNKYYAELYQRTSMPFSVIILTVLGLSLSSTKKRGGIGLNLFVGLLLAFAFIFSFQALLTLTEKGTFSPFFAVWLPNFIFGTLAVYLYLKRAYQ